jgi:hypothetical protein
VDERTYLIRYGIMSQVGRFAALPDCDLSFERGQVVVIQSHRGLELGEVLIPHDKPAPAQGIDDDPHAGPIDADSPPAHLFDRPRVLRLAGPEDLARLERAQELRSSRFDLCQRVLADWNWPWELIEVEPLLDDRATVLHYLGPQNLDVAALRARFRVACELDVVLEPAGTDPQGDQSHAGAFEDGGESGCGSCDCGSGGGCGRAAAPVDESAGPAATLAARGASPEPHGGCASCAIGRMMAQRARSRA